MVRLEEKEKLEKEKKKEVEKYETKDNSEK